MNRVGKLRLIIEFTKCGCANPGKFSEQAVPSIGAEAVIELGTVEYESILKSFEGLGVLF